MTVGELRSILSQFNDDFKVEFGIFGDRGYHYVDVCHNPVVGINSKEDTVLFSLDN